MCERRVHRCIRSYLYPIWGTRCDVNQIARLLSAFKKLGNIIMVF